VCLYAPRYQIIVGLGRTVLVVLHGEPFVKMRLVWINDLWPPVEHLNNIFLGIILDSYSNIVIVGSQIRVVFSGSPRCLSRSHGSGDKICRQPAANLHEPYLLTVYVVIYWFIISYITYPRVKVKTNRCE